MSTRAEQVRQRAEEEKQRIADLAKKAEEEASDVLNQHATKTPAENPVPTAATQPSPTPKPTSEPQSQTIGLSADSPMVKKKPDRQGIDLRPIDRERFLEFEMFSLRMKLGKKKGLTLYARAGMQLLYELMKAEPEKAKALFRRIMDEPG